MLAVAIEAAWEVLENSPLIIDRYREATIALGYTGDSIVNSVADIAWMALGFAFARRAPVWVTVAVGDRVRADRAVGDPRQSDAQHHHADRAQRRDPALAGGLDAAPPAIERLLGDIARADHQPERTQPAQAAAASAPSAAPFSPPCPSRRSISRPTSAPTIRPIMLPLRGAVQRAFS